MLFLARLDLSQNKYFDKTKYALENMHHNLSYIEHLKRNNTKDERFKNIK